VVARGEITQLKRHVCVGGGGEVSCWQPGVGG
jgi:hypothetical protein